jgi:hypothetical protein
MQSPRIARGSCKHTWLSTTFTQQISQIQYNLAGEGEYMTGVQWYAPCLHTCVSAWVSDDNGDGDGNVC